MVASRVPGGVLLWPSGLGGRPPDPRPLVRLPLWWSGVEVVRVVTRDESRCLGSWKRNGQSQSACRDRVSSVEHGGTGEDTRQM